MEQEILDREIVREIEANVAVSAGAGSGKTTNLGYRYINILLQNWKDKKFNIGNILCVTFTNMAVLEMRNKVRNALQDEINEAKDAALKKRLQEYLDNFETAQIMTLDALQGKILREHPVEAGVDPQYAVMESAEYNVETEKIVRRFLRIQVMAGDVNLKKVMAFYDPSAIRKALLARKMPKECDKNGCLNEWQTLAEDFSVFAEQEKLAKDIFGFDDVTYQCMKLLKNNPNVRKHYQKKFCYVMVDEFQDINDKQRQMIYMLCGEPDDGSVPGEKLFGNHLFVVGDKQQSIYRFRGAQVELFGKVQKEIESVGGKCLTINHNFRSTDKILGLVNYVFPQKDLFGADDFQVLKVGKSENVSTENNPKQLPKVRFFFGGEIKDLLWREAQCVAEEILVQNEKAKKIELLRRREDNKDMQLSDIPEMFGKMTILLEKRTKMGVLLRALNEQHIPYVCVDGLKFYEQQEVIDVLNLFRVLKDKDNDLALLSFLRSPFVGASDAEITELCSLSSNHYFDNLQNLMLSPLLQNAGEKLFRLHEMSQNVSLQSLWTEIWNSFNFIKVLLNQIQGVQKLANVQKLQQLAMDYVEQNVCGLDDWLEYVENTMEDSDESEANLPSDNCVRIMTIHKSKGLTLDYVFVLFLANEQEKGEDEEDKQAANEERKRLLYVAMTRAQSFLYLSASQTSVEGMLHYGGKDLKEKQTCGAWLWKALHKYDPSLDKDGNQVSEWVPIDDIAEIISDFENTGVNVTGNEEVHSNSSVEDNEQKTIENVCEPAKNIVVASKIVFTPTMLQTYLHCPRSYYYRYVCGLPEVDEGQGARSKEQGASEEQGNGLTAAEMGTLIHSALEHYDGDVEMAWASALRAQGPGFRTQDLGVSFAKTLFVNYVNSDLFKQIPQQHDREVKFQLPIDDGVSFQGIMDCVYQKPGGSYGIVDYKTGVMPGELNEGYAMQLAIYAKAVEQMYRKAKADDDSKVRVSELNLHYLQAGKALPITSKEEYYDKAVETAKEIQKLHTETDFDCKTEQCAHCGYQYLCRKDGKE